MPGKKKPRGRKRGTLIPIGDYALEIGEMSFNILKKDTKGWGEKKYYGSLEAALMALLTKAGSRGVSNLQELQENLARYKDLICQALNEYGLQPISTLDTRILSGTATAHSKRRKNMTKPSSEIGTPELEKKTSVSSSETSSGVESISIEPKKPSKVFEERSILSKGTMIEVVKRTEKNTPASSKKKQRSASKENSTS